MPTYAYTCTECGHAFDIHQSFNDAALTECPSCGGKLRKVFSSVGVVFKGSGFYRTDSRTSGGKSTATATSSAPAAPSTSTAAPAAPSTGSTAAPAASASSSTSSTGSSAAAKPAAG